MEHSATTCSILKTSILKKQLVALTALGLGLFITIHMLGNTLLFVGERAYNEYSHKLTSSPLIYVVEIGLLSIFALHCILTLTLAFENKKCRGQHKSSSFLQFNRKLGAWTSRNMVYTGLLVLAFVITHLINFRFGPVYETSYDGVAMRNIYLLAQQKFHDPLYVIFYEASLIILALHLSHGFKGLFQTLGFGSVLNIYIKRISLVFVLVLIFGFMSQPIYMYFFS